MIKKYITRNKFKVTSFKDQGYMISKDDEIIEIHPFT